MDTSELAQRLEALENAKSNREQFEGLTQLQSDLAPDGLEVVVDEDNQFAVRLQTSKGSEEQ